MILLKKRPRLVNNNTKNMSCVTCTAAEGYQIENVDNFAVILELQEVGINL